MTSPISVSSSIERGLLRDRLMSAGNRLRGTCHSPSIPGSLGDSMVCCSMGLRGASYMPALAAQEDALLQAGAALLVRYGSVLRDAALSAGATGAESLGVLEYLGLRALVQESAGRGRA